MVILKTNVGSTIPGLTNCPNIYFNLFFHLHTIL
uniref:Uncharacterized protein n=1 Tax=Rhizophora mucronata TaxID=61149 RepID=A0A2P2Q368_RHIMU